MSQPKLVSEWRFYEHFSSRICSISVGIILGSRIAGACGQLRVFLFLEAIQPLSRALHHPAFLSAVCGLFPQRLTPTPTLGIDTLFQPFLLMILILFSKKTHNVGYLLMCLLVVVCVSVYKMFKIAYGVYRFFDFRQLFLRLPRALRQCRFLLDALYLQPALPFLCPSGVALMSRSVSNECKSSLSALPSQLRL